MKEQNKLYREFSLSSWAIDSKNTIYVMISLFIILGVSAYYAMPRESFPEVVETKIYISTVFPGNTAEDMEKLVTNPLEDKVKQIGGLVKVTSTSQEDYSMIVAEFDVNTDVNVAKQKVKDEIDSETSSEDWPTFNGAKVEPNAFSLNLAEEIPILNVNLLGDFTSKRLKEYAEYLQDRIEDLPEIKAAKIRGAQKKEVEIAVDVFQMMASKVSFSDILNSIRNENTTMSAGNIVANGQRRTLRIIGEIEEPSALENIIVKNERGAVYLRDIATVSFQPKERTTFARSGGQNVVMLDVTKRSGQNMVEAASKIETIVAAAEREFLPASLEVKITNNQATKTINQVDDLVNNIIFGIILVVAVLMFFLGSRNALFVGFAIPMSMFMSFMILDALGYTLNTMILFGLIMGLGMLVDNGIVVVENVYRLMSEGMPRIEAAKKGIGEIAFPIIISTLTTVAAFVPLGMWPGTMGEFMKFFPITLSVVLGSSLFVAVFINSMLVSEFMKVKEEKIPMKKLIVGSLVLLLLGIALVSSGKATGGNLLIFIAVFFWVYKFVLKPSTDYFQYKILPVLENGYEKILRFCLRGWAKAVITVAVFILLIISFISFGGSVSSGRTKIEFFPDNKPNQVIVYVEYPQGTDIEKTNAVTRSIEQRIFDVIGADKYLSPKGENYIVESDVAQVGEGAGNPNTDGGSAAEMPHRGKITISLREYKYRNKLDSEELRLEIQKALTGVYPGISISVEKDAVGPPAGYPVNIELKGDDYNQLVNTAEEMRNYIDAKRIPGIAELKVDVNKSKPSMEIQVDRQKAGRLGVSTGMVGNQLRQSIFGAKAGVYKEGGDDFDINVRFRAEDRHNFDALVNQRMIFRDPASGKIKEIPISAVASAKNTSGFSAIKHKQKRRVVTVYSALTPGFTDAGVIVSQIEQEMSSFALPSGVSVDYTGQIEEQNKQQAFLGTAFFSGIGLIFLILIFQFNSISKPFIIMMAVLLSLIGVFGGLVITGDAFVIMMTMMGIISLAGIVVNNGVVLLDYTQLLIDRKRNNVGAEDNADLEKSDMTDAIVQGGKARLRPVLLTAITTILGLIPLAQGHNIDFFSFVETLDANYYQGGDNVIFWGPLAKTVINGLIVATFLTLIVVPVFFSMSQGVRRIRRRLLSKPSLEQA